MRLGFLLTAGILFLGITQSCSCNRHQQNAATSSKATLVLATSSEPDTLNPLFAEMAASWDVIALGSRELVMEDDKWNPIADLAVEIPTLDNGLVKQLQNGNMAVTWHIKPNAQWEDGVPVTGNDVVFGWKVCLDPTQEIIDRDTCQRVKSIAVDPADNKTFTVTWKEPFAFYNAYRVHTIVPAHILEPRYKAADGTTRDLKKDPYGNKPLSNGPFKIKEWIPGQQITYIRNERYEPKAKLEEVVVRIIPNNQSIESNLAAGSIDGVLPSGSLTIPQIEQLKKRKTPGLTYYSVPGMVWAHIDCNLDNPVLADIRIRKALAHAINREQIIKSIYDNQYEIADSFLPPLHWAAYNGIPRIAFDLNLASQLFDEAGWKQASPNAIRTNSKGERLVIQLSAASGARDIEQMEQVFQSDLKKIGVELQIDNKPAKVFFGKYARHRELPQLSFYSWGMDAANFGLTIWHKDYIPSARNNWLGQNYPGWRNDEVSQLLEEIPSILDEKKRQVLMKRVQELWFEDLPTIPMYFRPVVAVSKDTLRNFRPTGGTSPISWNAAEWSWQ